MNLSYPAERAFSALNLEQYKAHNSPSIASNIFGLECPYEEQYILRMMIKGTGDNDFKIPSELEWLRSTIEKANFYQTEKLKVHHSFCYVTVRHGLVESVTDDEWHVDGFSTKITHIPEQNYIWSNCYPTEYVTLPIKFPEDFDPMRHNIHSYIQKRVAIRKPEIKFLSPSNLLCVDPYVIHRRPSNIPEGTRRTFIRISFVPIEIRDDNNTQNPLLPVPVYGVDGVKDFRNKLLNY